MVYCEFLLNLSNKQNLCTQSNTEGIFLGLKEERIMRKGQRKKSDEELAEIASHYTVLKEFRKKEHAAYIAICKRGLHHLCSKMERCYENPSDEELEKIASQYDILKVFMEKEFRIYKIIKRRGLYEKLCGRMKLGHARKRTDEELAAVASRFDDLVEFKEKEPRTYSVIHNRGLYDKLCARMKRGKKVRYSDEELAEIASGYNSMQKFYTERKGAFLAICRRGLIAKLCNQMERQGSLYKRKIYVFTFSDGYAYVGLAKDPKVRYRQHTTPQKKISPVYKHIQETDATFEFVLLTEWLDKDVAAKVEDDYIKQYKVDGWKMLNTARGGGLGSLTRFYTDKRILQEVEKYEYFEDFKDGSPGFYRYIRIHHLKDKYCANMKHRKMTDTDRMAIIASCKSNGELWKKNRTVYKWLHKHHRLFEFFPKEERYLTDDERMAIIKTCKTRSELRQKSPREYKWLLRHNRLDDFFPK